MEGGSRLVSNTIDKRVVSMEFDNARFEQNAKTSMNTLDKLKKSLDFDGISNGLKNVSKASENFSLKNISDNLDSLVNRFSTIGIIGMRTIENLTDTAINHAKKILGFIQTGIVTGGKNRAMNLENANFQLQGLLKDEAKVAAVMENVGDAVDGTAYGLDAAAKVASQLAASGMEAGDGMFHALRGVAGVSAMTNSSYEDIGRIYTQIAGQGRLMGDQLLQLSGRGMNAAATLAEHFGKSEAEIRDMTSKGKISFEMFSEAMDSAFGEHAKKANETLTGALSNVKSALGRIGALFFSPLIKQNGALVQLLNALREKINGIKQMVVPVSEVVTDKINQLAKGVTNLVTKVDIKKAFTSKWSKLAGMMEEAGVSAESLQERLTKTAKENGISIDDLIKKYGSFEKAMSSGEVSTDIITKTIGNFSDTIDDSGKSLEYFNKIVKEVIMGNFGNGTDRVKALTEAGHNYADVQNLVNYIWERNGRTWSNCDLTLEEVTKTIDSLSDEQLQNIGYTKEQSEKLRKLSSDAKDANTPIGELINNLNKKSTGQLLIETLSNILDGLKGIAKAAKDAISELYSTVKDSGGIGTALEYFHDLSESFKMNDEKADKLKRTFKGIFAVLDMIRLLVGTGVNIVFKILKETLHLFNIDILDCTANVGDALVAFHDWLNSIIDVDGFIKGTAQSIKNVIDKIKEWYAVLKLTGPFKDFIKWIESTQGAIKKWFDGLKKANNIPKYIIDGLITGLKNGIPKVVNFIGGLATALIDKVKEVLQIHSPSRIMIAIGGMVVMGLIVGIKAATGTLGDSVADVFNSIIEYVKNINFGDIFAGIIGTGIAVGIYKIGSVIDKLAGALASALSGIGNILHATADLITQFGKSLKRLSKAAAFKIRMDGILKLAIAIGILVGCIVALSLIEDKDALWEAVGMVAVLAGMLFLLALAVEKMGSSAINIEKGKVNIQSVAGTLVAIAASMLVLAFAIEKLGTMKPEELRQGLLSMAGIAVALYIMLVVYKHAVKVMGEKDVEGAKIFFSSLAASIAALVAAVKILGTMSWEDLGKASVGLWELVAVITILMLASKMINGKENVGKNLMMVAVSLGIMALVVKLLGSIDPEKMGKGLAGIIILSIVIVGLMAATRLLSNDKGNIGLTLIQVAGAIAILALVCKMLGNVSVPALAKGIIAIEIFVAIIGELMFVVKKFGGNSSLKLGATLILIAGAIAILAAVSVVLGFVNIGALAKGIIAVGCLSVIMAMLIRAASNAENCKGNIIAITVAIGVMAAAVVILSLIDPKKLAIGTAAMLSMMAMFAVMIKASSKAEKGVVGIIAMAFVIALMATILVVLSNLKVESVIENAISLSVLMIAMTIVLKQLSNIGGKAVKAMIGAVALSALAIPLALFALVLAEMTALGVQNGIENAIALSILVGAMTLCLIPLSLIGNLVVQALLGVLALTALAAPMVVFIGVLVLMNNIGPAMDNVDMLIKLMWNLTGMLAVLALVGPFALIGVAAMSALVVLMGVVGTLATAIGALMRVCPDLEEFIDNGLGILNKLAYGIGEMIGNFIKGFSETVMDLIPKLGRMLSLFAINIQPFLLIMRTVDDQVAVGVGIITASILALAVAEIISGIASLVTLGGSFADLGTQLSMFAINAFPFLMTMSAIDPDAMAGAKMLAETLLILTAADLISGIASIFGQKIDLGEFGKQLVPFGESLASFSAKVDGKINPSAVEAAKNAGMMMLDLANNLPKTGGFLQSFFGEAGSMETFGEQLDSFGSSIVSFSNTVTENPINSDAVESAKNAGETMMELNDKLPKTGGALQSFLGENNMEDFGNKLESFGDSIVAFSNTLTENPINSEAIESAKNAGMMLAELANTIPSEGGFWSSIVGGQSLEKFGNQLKPFGTGLKDFSAEIKDVNPYKLELVSKASKYLGEVASIIPNYGGMGSWFTGGQNLAEFGKQLGPLGTGLSDFATNLGTTNLATVTSAASNIKDIATDVKDISGTEVDGVKDFVDAINKLKDADFSGFIKNADDYTSSAYTIGQDIMTQFNDGFTDYQNKIIDSSKDAMTGVVNEFKGHDYDFKVAGNNIALHTRNGINHSAPQTKIAIASLADSLSLLVRYRYSNMYKAGVYLVTGLRNGINDSTSKATTAITVLMDEVIKAAKNTADIHSPSRVFAKMGYYVVAGFANGIVNNTDMSTNASETMTNKAIDNVKTAMTRLCQMFDDDLNTSPTITPVMDLSSVNRGMAAISDMMTNNSFSLNTNTDPVRAALHTKNQNGIIDNRKTSNMDVTNNNTFNISNASNPKAVAVEVSDILRRQIERVNL